MYIRKKKNKSGSYSISLFTSERIDGKNHPVPKLIKSFGASSDEGELLKLWAQAESYKEQLMLVAQPVVKLLKIRSEVDIKNCKSYNVGFYDVYGYYFDKIFNTIELKEEDVKKLKELIILRVANPCSKRKTASISLDYGIECTVNNIYRLMDKLTDHHIKKIKEIIYTRTQALMLEYKREVNILFYDLTTIYFETNTQDELREFGFSKDGKHMHVQIMLAAIVTNDGLPIDYQEFIGNTYEGHTLIPVINNLKSTYNINNVVIVADSALMNKINLEELEKLNIRYIIAARIKNSTKKLKNEILNLDNYNTMNATTSTKATDDILKSKIITLQDKSSLVAYYSSKRARKDFYDREKGLEKIQKHLLSTAKSKLTGSLKKSYVKITKECKIEIDHAKLLQESQYDGFFAFTTNIQNPDPSSILSSYRGLWQIEQTFRIAKSSLDIRPVYHYTTRRIKAHFIICFMALTIIRNIEFILKLKDNPLPIEQMHSLLEQMRKVNIVVDHTRFEILETPPEDIIKIYQLLNIPLQKNFSIY